MIEYKVKEKRSIILHLLLIMQMYFLYFHWYFNAINNYTIYFIPIYFYLLSEIISFSETFLHRFISHTVFLKFSMGFLLQFLFTFRNNTLYLQVITIHFITWLLFYGTFFIIFSNVFAFYCQIQIEIAEICIILKVFQWYFLLFKVLDTDVQFMLL